MSNEQHEVTVYDRAPATAPVSVAQVEAYLRRTWQCIVPVRHIGFVARHESGACVSIAANADLLDEALTRVGVIEKRQPSAVLADIAREPAP